MHPNEESMLGTVIVLTTFYLATANTWFRRVNKVFGIVGNKIYASLLQCISTTQYALSIVNH